MDRRPALDPKQAKEQLAKAGQQKPWEKGAPQPRQNAPQPNVPPGLQRKPDHRQVREGGAANWRPTRPVPSNAPPRPLPSWAPPSAVLAPGSEPAVACVGGELIQCDQVIFTSVRTATSEGYAVSAASRGARPEEKSEITRWAPSHRGLVPDTEDAEGLISFKLTSGRHAVGLVRHAGWEQSARGGMRVHTHAVLLDAKQFAAFDANPIRIHAALRKCLGAEPPLLEPRPLELLPLGAGFCATLPPVFAGHDDAGRFNNLVAAIIARQRWIVPGMQRPLAMVEWALDVLPMFMRQDIPMSVNVRFSSARNAQLVILDSADRETKRAVCGHDVRWCDLAAAPAVSSSGMQPWLTLVKRMSMEGRFRELGEVTARLDEAIPAASLSRIANMWEDADRLPGAPQHQRKQILARYADFKPAHPVEVDLLEKILSR